MAATFDTTTPLPTEETQIVRLRRLNAEAVAQRLKAEARKLRKPPAKAPRKPARPSRNGKGGK